MIECHPLLRPVVQLAKPVVHAVRHWHPRVVGVRHHVTHHAHRLLTAATPPQAVMTVCQRVAGPIVAGGLVLLPPASAVPPAGGVGGFPGAIVPEYGAPAFAPGYAGGGPIGGGYAPGTAGYGPGALGLGGILAPGSIGSSVPQSTTPGTTTPILLATTTPVPGNTPPTVVSGPNQPGTSTPSGPGDTPSTPPNNPTNPTNPTGPTNPGGTQPGDDTPVVNTPEPASITVLAGILAVVVFSRSVWSRRVRRL